MREAGRLLTCALYVVNELRSTVALETPPEVHLQESTSQVTAPTLSVSETLFTYKILYKTRKQGGAFDVLQIYY